jgi:hypothetical protein
VYHHRLKEQIIKQVRPQMPPILTLIPQQQPHPQQLSSSRIMDNQTLLVDSRTILMPPSREQVQTKQYIRMQDNTDKMVLDGIDNNKILYL